MFDRKFCCCNLKGKLRESFCRVYQLWKSFKFHVNKSSRLHLKSLFHQSQAEQEKETLSMSKWVIARSWTFPPALVTHIGCSGWVFIRPGGTQPMAPQPHAACKAAQPLVEVPERPKRTWGTLAHGLWKVGGCCPWEPKEDSFLNFLSLPSEETQLCSGGRALNLQKILRSSFVEHSWTIRLQVCSACAHGCPAV